MPYAMLAKSTDTISSLEFGKFLKSISEKFDVQAGCSESTHWQFFTRFIKRNREEVLGQTQQSVPLFKERKTPGAKPYNISHLTEKQVLSYIGLHRKMKRVKDAVCVEFQKLYKVPLKDKLKVTLGKLGVVLGSDLDDLKAEGALMQFDESAMDIDAVYAAYVEMHKDLELKIPPSKSGNCHDEIGDYGDLLLGVLTENVTLKKQNKVIPKGTVLEITFAGSGKVNGVWGPFFAICFARIPHKPFIEFCIPFSAFSFVINKDLVDKINKVSLPAPKGISAKPLKDRVLEYNMD